MFSCTHNYLSFYHDKGNSYPDKDTESTYFKEGDFVERVSPVYKGIEKTKEKLKNINLIGFAGAPWTLLVYMINRESPKKNYHIQCGWWETGKIREPSFHLEGPQKKTNEHPVHY